MHTPIPTQQWPGKQTCTRTKKKQKEINTLGDILMKEQEKQAPQRKTGYISSREEERRDLELEQCPALQLAVLADGGGAGLSSGGAALLLCLRIPGGALRMVMFCASWFNAFYTWLAEGRQFLLP
jgi:hypothetical protein